MTVAIRLAKFGKKNAPSYRLVATDKRSSRRAKALEILGSYNPSQQPPQLLIKRERLHYWQKQGAQVSVAVQKIIEGKYVHKIYRPGQATTKKE